MLFRLFRAIKALAIGTFLATNPVKGVVLIVLGVMLPYLAYAFLGGALFMTLLFGTIILVWWLVARNEKSRAV
ncbi:MAG: hypothetical protein R3222_10615 [Balneolaceae bacterium]|nr:hypothetical protein [Balneolaceae bacterium]